MTNLLLTVAVMCVDLTLKKHGGAFTKKGRDVKNTLREMMLFDDLMKVGRK